MENESVLMYHGKGRRVGGKRQKVVRVLGKSTQKCG
jgi:hypothetical protein